MSFFVKINVVISLKTHLSFRIKKLGFYIRLDIVIGVWLSKTLNKQQAA